MSNPTDYSVHLTMDGEVAELRGRVVNGKYLSTMILENVPVTIMFESYVDGMAEQAALLKFLLDEGWTVTGC